jgi:hypothetical protein
MEKHFSAAGYWLGLICASLALLTRILIAFDFVPVRIGSADGLAISYISFYHGAALFFLLSIASWCRTSKN